MSSPTLAVVIVFLGILLIVWNKSGKFTKVWDVITNSTDAKGGGSDEFGQSGIRSTPTVNLPDAGLARAYEQGMLVW